VAGPAGHVFGRKAGRRAIHVITAKPTRDLTGYVHATYGNYDRLEIEGAISGPISSTLSARIAARSEDRDGFGVMAGTNRGIDDNNRQMARAQLMWEPSSDFSWLVSGEWFRQNDYSGAPHVGAMAFPDPDNPGESLFVYTGTGGYPDPDRPRDSAGDFDPFFQAKSWAVTSTMTWDASDWLRLVNITNYRDFKVDHGMDYDVSDIINTSATRGLATVHKAETSEQFTNELQLQTDTEWVKGVLGLYYFNEKLNSKTFYGIDGPGYFGPAENLEGLALSGVDPVDAFAHCGIADRAFGPGDPNPPPNFCAYARHETNVWAVFGQYLVNLETLMGLPGVSLKLGGRYTTEKRSVNNAGFFASSGGAGLIPAAIGSRTFKKFTPEIGIEWQANPDILLYYTYSEGFKSGVGEGLSPGTARIIDPENIRNHEVGIKSSLANGRLTLNLAAFSYTLDGMQIQKTAPNNLGIPEQLFENAAEVEAKGFELEANARPIDRLRINASVAYLDSKFSDFETIDPLDPRNVIDPYTIGLISPVVSLVGNPTRNSPEWSLSGGVEADVAEFDNGGTITARVDAFYRSTTYYSEFKRLSEGQEGFGMIDAWLRYRSPDKGFEASLWVKNLTDKLAVNGTYPFHFQGFIGPTYYPPRTWGVTVGYSF